MFATRVGFYYQAPPSDYDVGFAHYLTPAIAVYKWTDAGGFGTKYSNPAVNMGSDGSGFAWNPSGLSILGSSSGGLQAYRWSSAGFGTKYTNAVGAIGSWARGTSFNPAGSVATFANFRSSPYVSAWPWSDASGFGTKYANPTLPSTGGFILTWNNAGTAMVYGSEGTPYMHAWAWSGSGWGTKYANPTGLPTSTSDGSEMGMNPANTAVSRANATSPFIWVYTWNNSTGFGTKYANPTTPVSGACYSLGSPYWSPDGTVITVISDSASPFAQAYQWNDSTGFGTKYANPTTAVPAVGPGRINITGNAFIMGSSSTTSPWIHAYAWNNSTGFGTKYANPSTLVNASPYGISTPATKLATT